MTTVLHLVFVLFSLLNSIWWCACTMLNPFSQLGISVVSSGGWYEYYRYECSRWCLHQKTCLHMFLLSLYLRAGFLGHKICIKRLLKEMERHEISFSILYSHSQSMKVMVTPSYLPIFGIFLFSPFFIITLLIRIDILWKFKSVCSLPCE